MKVFFRYLILFFFAGGVSIAFCCSQELDVVGVWYVPQSTIILPGVDDLLMGNILFLAACLTAVIELSFCQPQLLSRHKFAVLIPVLGGYPATMIGAALLGPVLIGVGASALSWCMRIEVLMEQFCAVF